MALTLDAKAPELVTRRVSEAKLHLSSPSLTGRASIFLDSLSSSAVPAVNKLQNHGWDSRATIDERSVLVARVLAGAPGAESAFSERPTLAA